MHTRQEAPVEAPTSCPPLSGRSPYGAPRCSGAAPLRRLVVPLLTAVPMPPVTAPGAGVRPYGLRFPADRDRTPPAPSTAAVARRHPPPRLAAGAVASPVAVRSRRWRGRPSWAPVIGSVTSTTEGEALLLCPAAAPPRPAVVLPPSRIALAPCSADPMTMGPGRNAMPDRAVLFRLLSVTRPPSRISVPRTNAMAGSGRPCARCTYKQAWVPGKRSALVSGIVTSRQMVPMELPPSRSTADTCHAALWRELRAHPGSSSEGCAPGAARERERAHMMSSAQEPEPPVRPWWKRLFDAVRRGAAAVEPIVVVAALAVEIMLLVKG